VAVGTGLGHSNIEQVMRWLFRWLLRRQLEMNRAAGRGSRLSRNRPIVLEPLERRELLATATLSPVADNTLYQDATTNSNGAGTSLFAGETSRGFGARRALLKFDVAASVPAGAHIDSVALQLHVSKDIGGANTFGAYLLSDNWGEGASNAGDPGGDGTPATTNDATWISRFFNASPPEPWTTPGGDFQATASATTSIGGLGFVQFSSASLASNVQAWLDGTSGQFGWLVKAVDESIPGTALKFDSRESLTTANRPQLTINYTAAAVNQQPTLSAITDPAAILEDAGPQTINLSGISAGPQETQNLSITATSSNPALLPNPTVSYTSPNATGSLSYKPAPNASGSAVITVTVKDDGGTAAGGVDSVTRSFTVNVTAINDPPTLDPISDPLAIPQDSGQQTVSLSGISAGPLETQSLTLSVASSNPALIPIPTVHYTSPSSTGSLTYTPAAGQAGVATITVTVKDNGGTASGGSDTITRTFKVLVTAAGAVNEPPSFTKGADQTANDNSGLVTVAGWATNISAGPPDESDQAVHFIVVPVDSSLFTVQPRIDPAGNLTFTPAPNAHGTTPVSVKLQDNGGTANGGVDTSPAQTFLITIDKPLIWHNTLHALDVSNSSADGVDGIVAAGDALAVINYINAHVGQSAIPPGAAFGPPYIDTFNSAKGDFSGDNIIAPADALAVINFINASGAGHSGPAGEGEAVPAAGEAAVDSVFQQLGTAPSGASLAAASSDALIASLLASIDVPGSTTRRQT
jgi:hypothetical protein